MKKIALIKAGGTFEELCRKRGDFEDWTISGMGFPTSRIRVVPVFEGELPPDPESVAGIVMTGSHSMVTDREEWSEKLCPWIRRAVGKAIPFLGICYGHQLMARALGGEVGDHPRGPEIGTILISLPTAVQSDPLFSGFSEPFLAHVTHTQSVLRLPPEARALASSAYEPFHAVVFGKLAWGIQFHPEFDAEIMRHYVDTQAEKLRHWGHDPQRIRDMVVETPESNNLLARFGQLVMERDG
jgi:GMP synthase (glutamine-hydrolysing)